MLRPIALFFSGLVLLNGCSLLPGKGTGSKGAVSVIWYCVKESDTGTQTCEKRRVRDGKPVDNEVYETIVIPVDAPTPVVEAPQKIQTPHSPPANAGDAVPWSRQPLTKVNQVEEPGGLEVENIGPEVRKPRDTAKVSGSTPINKTEQKAVVPMEKLPIEPEPAPVEKSTGYTLQLAAFATAERCDAYVAKQAPAELPVEKRIIPGLETDWCIVVHGDFASESEAQLVVERYADKYPKINFWVRNWASIQ